ncbi:peptide chain release factor N(5)-glutamine methyltransferase [Methylobacterium radiotolerans]|uniref:peptide chain release factor N(5)-glutamine methyltransferase n=1 Tax=Methylobacterium TaxID=407 RepID=UPI0005E5D8E2|nr:peptide chain release factor N(5)-glutamine methyltransferase [Methylobacterium radiotolerans]MBN6818038.1 peptide chain release factor N(5)-glutamine methyltransferase [Methylobacterium organophilum]GAN46481.1 protein-(glutamine-N5) methyltransferase [Methylobacterium sp. ME121]MCX4196692.1 peptide chain release factor N(5)-glutamine methyltransferase [Methylobacterium organophilum]ONF48799.1 SAM-dependent methyltransferase [Methylobacterium radiotolerans]OXE41432.1 protein-(glutamine-N5) 
MTPDALQDLSRREALRALTARLHAGGVAEAAGDARFLLLGILGLETRDLLIEGGRRLGPADAASLAAALARRLAGEPVARILGAWEFWGLPFRLGPDTLVPRPDTEILVEVALAARPDRAAPLRCLDLGTGTGCILTALLSERPRATGVGLDRSEGALRVAWDNAVTNGVGDRARFVAGDWCDALRGRFDLVVSNPPYIARAVIGTLEREVRGHDPAAALDGGADGLEAYRRILGGAGACLALGGLLVLEIGYDQAAAVTDLARAAGYRARGLTRDLAGHDRVLSFDRPEGLFSGHRDA